MFVVTIENDGVALEIHGESEKLKSGKVVKGVNAIDSFSFSLLPSNVGWDQINDFTTLVKVYNTNKDRYEFYGRVLYSDTTMAESGLITKDVTCESYFGFLCDSQQTVVAEQNWTVTGLLQAIIDQHNSQVEEYKRFTIGEVTVTDPNDNLYKGIQYENTWDTLKDKLLDTLGGEIRFRVVDGVNYIDYLTEIGKTSETEIAVSKNMKSIKQEKDPSAYITRLIPLGMKMGENDERLTIEEVNGGLNYIDDEYGIEKYGIHVGYQTWDDVTLASNLFTKAKAWLQDNNKLKIKYSITALDLSLLGLDIDDFDVCNWHPLVNPLLGIDDVARITKKSIDVCEEVKSTIEVGENFKTASDIQIEQQQQAKKTYSQIVKTNEQIKIEVKNEVEDLASSVDVSLEEIKLTVQGQDEQMAALDLALDEISLKVQDNANGIAALDLYVDSLCLSVSNGSTSSTIKLMAGNAEIDSENITFTGFVTFTGLSDGTTTIDGGCIKTGTIDAERLNLSGAITWGDLDSTVQDDINDAWSMAYSAQQDATDAADMVGAWQYGSTTYIDGEMLMTGTVKASSLLGGEVGLLTASEINIGGLSIAYTSSGYGLGIYTDYGGIQILSAGNVWMEANGGAQSFAIADGYISCGADVIPRWSESLNLGWSSYLWDGVYASACTACTSDQNKKHDIEVLPDKYIAMLDMVEPKRFKLNSGTSDRYHVGFIAQDIETAMNACGVDSLEFGGWIKDKDADGNDIYMLRYEEFIAVLWAKIKQLENRICALEV